MIKNEDSNTNGVDIGISLKPYVAEIAVMAFSCICATGFVVAGLHFVKTDTTTDENVVAAVSGALVSFIVMQIIKMFEIHKKSSHLKTALLMEVGLIARALYHDIQVNHSATSDIKETLNINHAIIHCIGSDISFLASEVACDILEFHSLVKVMLNMCSNSKLKYDTTDRVMLKITEIISKYQQCEDIVKKSSLAFANYNKWLNQKK